jgi:hypothetical protein
MFGENRKVYQEWTIQRHGQHWGTKVTTLGREDTGRRLTKQTKNTTQKI